MDRKTNKLIENMEYAAENGTHVSEADIAALRNAINNLQELYVEIVRQQGGKK